jgi:membrane protein YqaA with SNARE-associated domain
MEAVSALRVKAACVGCAGLSLDSLTVLLFLSSSTHLSFPPFIAFLRSGKLSRFVLYLALTRLNSFVQYG